MQLQFFSFWETSFSKLFTKAPFVQRSQWGFRPYPFSETRILETVTPHGKADITAQWSAKHCPAVE